MLNFIRDIVTYLNEFSKIILKTFKKQMQEKERYVIIKKQSFIKE